VFGTMASWSARRIKRDKFFYIKRGKIGQFSLDMLVGLASLARLKPKLKLAKQARKSK
jgi:hypothetical protein